MSMAPMSSMSGEMTMVSSMSNMQNVQGMQQMRPMMGQNTIMSQSGMNGPMVRHQMGPMGNNSMQRQGQPNMIQGQPRMINAPGGVRMQNMVS
jgi:hypothetical protein